MTEDQTAAFVAHGGFEPATGASLLLGAVFVVLLLWGVWAVHSAYVGWTLNTASARDVFIVAVRFIALYVLLTFLLLS